MASRGETTPLSMTMMGGPIDARKSPTAVNNLAMNKSLHWFENNVIYRVPATFPGAGRRVYPGFLQHTGFVAMNPSNHAKSHYDYFQDLIKGDGASRSPPQVLRRVQRGAGYGCRLLLELSVWFFQDFSLVSGTWDVKGVNGKTERVRPQDITTTALFSPWKVSWTTFPARARPVPCTTSAVACPQPCKNTLKCRVLNTAEFSLAAAGASSASTSSPSFWRTSLPSRPRGTHRQGRSCCTLASQESAGNQLPKPTPRKAAKAVVAAENSASEATKTVAAKRPSPARSKPRWLRCQRSRPGFWLHYRKPNAHAVGMRTARPMRRPFQTVSRHQPMSPRWLPGNCRFG